jgi:hypothetical protein
MKLQTFSPHAFSLTLALGTVISAALKVPLARSLERRTGGTSVSRLSNLLSKAAASGSDTGLNVTTVQDLIYMANISVGGVEYTVQLDTGSSDLWIQGQSTSLPNVNQTTMTYNLTYGLGWASGYISYAPVEFAGISVPSQALLDVSSANNPALGYNADGIFGLGFTRLSSIDAFLNGTNSSTGRSLLYNLFADNPSLPNFIAFALESSQDSADDIGGSFSVGEYEPKYSAVVNNTAIPTWPTNSPKRWNVLLDAIIVGGTTITPTTTVVGAPKAVTLLDSGTTYTYAPTDICNAIYGDVDGAHFDSDSGQWIVPCSIEIDLAFQFGDQIFPVHPLDITPKSLTDPTTCVGSFLPQSVSVGAGEFDWLVGDNFLRSVYTVYDFGDFDASGNMGNPYVKLLSLIDPNQASVEFHNNRGGIPATNITYNASNVTSSSSSVSVTLPDDVAQTLDKVGKYLPVMFGVMALNAVVLLALVVVGVIFLCRKRRPRVTPRKTRGRMSPMPLNHTSSFMGPDTPQPLHTYQPVSEALTEDTLFTPPSPAFHAGENDGLRGHRPKSLA